MVSCGRLAIASWSLCCIVSRPINNRPQDAILPHWGPWRFPHRLENAARWKSADAQESLYDQFPSFWTKPRLVVQNWAE
jgi:hypothetical protein